MLHNIIYLLVTLIWAAFVAYWVFSWLYDKATHKDKPIEKATSRSAFWGVRLLLIVVVIFLVFRGGLGTIGVERILPYYLPLSEAGTAILACSIGFAIWARRTLGGNWSARIVLKKGQTLVKTGPYSIVRHPIYTGLIFGVIGTFLAVGSAITLVFAFGVILFATNRIRIEETLMFEKFGKQYVQYRKQAKMFVPFIY